MRASPRLPRAPAPKCRERVTCSPTWRQHTPPISKCSGDLYARLAEGEGRHFGAPLDGAARCSVPLRRQWRALFRRFDAVVAPTFGTVAYPHVENPNEPSAALQIDGRTTPYFEQLAWPGVATFPDCRRPPFPSHQQRGPADRRAGDRWISSGPNRDRGCHRASRGCQASTRRRNHRSPLIGSDLLAMDQSAGESLVRSGVGLTPRAETLR